MEAGWYRYMSQWRFTPDGTIKPRFGFAAVENSCVCNRHHHAYWRFDFDIRGAGSNQVYEHNNPPLSGSTNPWRRVNHELRRSRSPARQRHWRVQNTESREAYLIIPGPNDGVARWSPDWPFPRGDVWIMGGKRTAEIDDGVVAVGPPYEADLDRFISGESIRNQDVLVWYAGHFTHDLSQEEPATHGHIIGPDLVPENW
jgi:Cu2+-containing amine oxidase